mmetsp:Transcript_9155/g.20983  ORF Transcript_9155/g.20983 Transcript_9155/m.20983 type:complete len:247 (-) Transcript_9155:475-1215(-)
MIPRMCTITWLHQFAGIAFLCGMFDCMPVNRPATHIIARGTLVPFSPTIFTHFPLSIQMLLSRSSSMGSPSSCAINAPNISESTQRVTAMAAIEPQLLAKTSHMISNFLPKPPTFMRRTRRMSRADRRKPSLKPEVSITNSSHQGMIDIRSTRFMGAKTKAKNRDVFELALPIDESSWDGTMSPYILAGSTRDLRHHGEQTSRTRYSTVNMRMQRPLVPGGNPLRSPSTMMARLVRMQTVIRVDHA